MSEQAAAPAAPLTEEQRDAASAAKAQAYKASFGDNPPAAETPAETPVAHEKPEHVPEKFFNKDTGEVNYEAWNAAHAALEAKFHQGSNDTAGESEETPADDKPAADGDSESPASVILETPAAQKAAAEYAEFGEISADGYKALEAQGLTRDVVDTYIAGQEAKAKVFSDAAYEPVGGEEAYGEMIQWAAENLDEASKAAYNAQVATGNPAVIRKAVESLAAIYGKEATVEGERTGGSPPADSSAVFNSRAEMTAAINKVGENGKRLYDVDSAYRNDVMRKIGNSRKKGTLTF